MFENLFKNSFLFVWVIFWSLGTLGFDCLLGYSMFHQIRTCGFDSIEGQVLSSEVVTNLGSDGDTYEPKVTYEFIVNGSRFESEQIRYGMGSSSDNYASELVKRYPAGDFTTVYYHSSNPEDSVLIRGIEGRDLFLIMFMTPFNLIMLGVWKFLAKPTDPNVYLAEVSPVGWVLLGLSFANTFAIAFIWGLGVSVFVMLMTWGLTLAATAGVWFWCRCQNSTIDIQ